MERYKRQLGLIGEDGQEKLNNAWVLIVGAGGLGNICAKFLASSGVGNIMLVDYDNVALSNLNRQIMFNDSLIGKNKADALHRTLSKVNPEINVRWSNTKIQDMKVGWLNGFNVIVDCTDNMETSYYLEFEALRLGIPLVFAKTSKWFGVVTVIRDKAFLKENYPTKQLNKDHSVFAPLGGVIGSLQAGLAIKLILGLKVDNDVMYYDFLNNATIRFKK